MTGTRPKQKKIKKSTGKKSKKSTGKKLKKKEELKELKKKEDCPRNKNKDIREMMRRWEERKEQRKDGGQSLGDTEDLQILDRSTPETPRIRNRSKEKEDGRDRGTGGGLESRKYTNNHLCQEDPVTGRKQRSILDQMMTGARLKKKVMKKTPVRKTPVRKMVNKVEDLPTEKARNIGEVMRLWKERDRKEQAAGFDRKPRTPGQEQVGPIPVVVDDKDDDNVFVDDDCDDDSEVVDVDDVDVDLTSLGGLGETDRTEHVEPHVLTDRTLKIKTDLSRKRKLSPVLIQDTPVKKGRCTPLPGMTRKSSEKILTNDKLITNHFKYFSLVSSRSEGQALPGAVGHAGWDGGGDGAVLGACAKTESGQTWEGKGGKARRVLSQNTIGPDSSADGISANPGCSNIQLILRKFQRGNGSKLS